MSSTHNFILNLFNTRGIAISKERQPLFEHFVHQTDSEFAVQMIEEKQEQLIADWRLHNTIADVLALPLILPNATCGKPYTAEVRIPSNDIISITHIEGLEAVGLVFDAVNGYLSGQPQQSGDFNIELLLTIGDQSGKTSSTRKKLVLTVNPDPKTLWKNLPSDPNALFWKPDESSVSVKLGDKKLVVASVRGRSHQNSGIYRDDDFSYREFNKTGWSLVAVADGAGSSPLSRKGSQLACDGVATYFETLPDDALFHQLETKLLTYESSEAPELLQEAEILSKQALYKAVLQVHQDIRNLAETTSKTHPELFHQAKAKHPGDHFHTTLIFTLYKKYKFGYVLMSFSVGDCPIAVINTDQSETTLLNWLDVGEFGGGTRFITQPDIFHSKDHPMASRFSFKVVPDFSYLFLMTDGVYDPKFVVEANLEKHERWLAFLADLKGRNEDGVEVILDSVESDPAHQLRSWLQFWSTGNHDDRTLAIVY